MSSPRDEQGEAAGPLVADLDQIIPLG